MYQRGGLRILIFYSSDSSGSSLTTAPRRRRFSGRRGTGRRASVPTRKPLAGSEAWLLLRGVSDGPRTPLSTEGGVGVGVVDVELERACLLLPTGLLITLMASVGDVALLL